MAAASLKLQASSFKPQAASLKLQEASSLKLQASSRKPQALGNFKLHLPCAWQKEQQITINHL